jgi:predicted HicB family RNase H-like nuclease
MAIKGKEVIKAIKAEQKTEETVNLTFRIPKDLADRFKAICEKQGVSSNKAVIKLLQEFMADF